MSQLLQALHALKDQVEEMGNLAQTMVVDAASLVVAGDDAAIERVRRAEPRLDASQVAVDGDGIRLITIHTPVARDLRFVLMIVRITSELERMGDEAVNIVDALAPVAERGAVAGDLAGLSAVVQSMVRRALESFRDEDLGTARRILAEDDAADAKASKILGDLMAPTISPADASTHLRIALAVRALERIADHATNICEEVIYLVDGADIRHQSV